MLQKRMLISAAEIRKNSRYGIVCSTAPSNSGNNQAEASCLTSLALTRW